MKTIVQCLNCGNDIETRANPKYRKKFCNNSCSSQYNNKNREPEVYIKQSLSLRNTVKLKRKYAVEYEPIDLQKFNGALCEFGCDQIAKYKLKSILDNDKLCCSKYKSYCTNVMLEKRIDKKEKGNNIKIEKVSERKGLHYWLNNPDSYFGYGVRSRACKQIIIHERGYKCEECGLKSWQGKPVTLELHHIDSDSNNNIRENLSLLCPNCHSQTHSYRNRNVKKRDKVPDDILVDALKIHYPSLPAALRSVGLSPVSGNYVRCYRLIAEYKII